MAQGVSAPPHVIADVIWRAASTRHPKTRYAAPFSAKVILGLRWVLSDRLFDRVWGRVMGIPATVGSSVVEDRKAQLAEALGVGDHVDLDDLAACDREIEHEEQPSTPGHDESHGSVHKSRSRSLGTPRELPGHGQRTTDLP
jgi:hypothetical protein